MTRGPAAISDDGKGDCTWTSWPPAWPEPWRPVLAPMAEEENLTKKDGELVGAWGWFDKAFHVNKSAEVANGDLERRLDDF